MHYAQYAQCSSLWTLYTVMCTMNTALCSAVCIKYSMLLCIVQQTMQTMLSIVHYLHYAQFSTLWITYKLKCTMHTLYSKVYYLHYAHRSLPYKRQVDLLLRPSHWISANSGHSSHFQPHFFHFVIPSIHNFIIWFIAQSEKVQRLYKESREKVQRNVRESLEKV